MKCRNCTSDHFGAPENFSGSKLPNFGQVGKQWRSFKQVLETGKNVSKWDIARDVRDEREREREREREANRRERKRSK